LGEEVERRLAAAAEAWLPAHDRDARALILAFLREVEEGGADAIAELLDGTRRWFGARAAAALPVPCQKQMHAGSDTIALEPLPPARHPTMWPQRPKRRTDELFSSWLWRTAVAAGVPPHRFARDVLGTASDDIDRDVAPATLRRLAQLSGQTFEHLAGGILSETVIVTQETPAGLAEDALLRDGRFLLNAEKSDRLGRPRPVLQYCPRCLEADARPHFRRSWRFAHAVVCVDHGCRLYDRCWTCGGVITPLTNRVVDARPRCPSCHAWLGGAPLVDATRAQPRQRALHAMLFYLVARIAPDERRLHLDTLSGCLSNSATTSIVQRERSLLGLRASAPDGWFGQPMRAEHAAPLRMLSMGVMFDRVAKTAALRQRRARIRSLGGDQPPSALTKNPDQPAATR
jgi:hypothetical protein